jgi:hypothetical protein
MACAGCEHLQHENTGISILARMQPFCAGYDTKLKRDGNGHPVPYAGCSKATEQSEDDYRGCSV